MTIAIGPAFSCLDYKPADKLDTSFRVVTAYHISTDSYTVRLDIMKSGVQMNVGFHIGSPTGGGSDLVMPASPAYLGFSVRANSQDLVTALRGMADRLEQQLKDDEERRKP